LSTALLCAGGQTTSASASRARIRCIALPTCGRFSAAVRLIVIRQHIDNLFAVGPCGLLDVAALDLRRRVLRAPDRPPRLRTRMNAIARLCTAEQALCLCCVLLRSRTRPPSTRPLKHRYRNDGWGRRPRMPGTVRGDRLRQDTCHLGTCSRPWPWHAITGHRRRARWRCRQSCSRMGGGLTVKALVAPEPHCWRRRPEARDRVHANAIAGGRARGL
jgi:hypothetical protein